MNATDQFFAVRGQSFRAEDCAAAQETDVVTLVPDPDNKFHDTIKYPGTVALKVMAGERHIGFVPAELVWWFQGRTLANLHLHKSRTSGMWIVYFDADEYAPKQGIVEHKVFEKKSDNEETV